MVVKYIAALAYTAVWGVIFLGLFRPLHELIWVVMLVLATVGALSAWNALAPPKRDDDPLHDVADSSQCCEGSPGADVTLIKPVETHKP